MIFSTGYQKTTVDVQRLIKLQRRYGQQGNDSRSHWLLRRRTINTACSIIDSISNYDFVDFELALYFYSNDAKVSYFMRAFEGQLEEAVMHPESFVKNLDSFYWKMCFYIEENHLYRDFYDFCALLEQQRRLKIREGHKKIFDSYTSMVMQMTAYFCRNRIEDSVVGITESGDLMFRKNPHPYCDLGEYELERYYPDFMRGKKEITPGIIKKAYQKYGYSIETVEQISCLAAFVNVFDNNQYILAPYINEDCLDIQVNEPYGQLPFTSPRCWKETAFYKEMLLRRNYMLPSGGIRMEFVNAGDIRKILFMETIHNEQIIMLYHVFTHTNGEFSGYFNTKNQVFFSIFEHTNQSGWHTELENFILECYMILTCDYDIDRKKNYAIRQVAQLEGEFHYPFQPLAAITYQVREEGQGNRQKKNRNYDKRNYQEEFRHRNGRIRNLPVGQHASDKAQQYALDMGYCLPPGKTYIRAYKYRVYCKVKSKSLGIA